MRSGLPAAAVAPPALQGIQDPADILGDCLKTGIVLLHPRENLPDVPTVFFQLSLVPCDIVALPGDNLGEIPDDSSHNSDLAPKLGKAGSGTVHVVPPDLRESFQR